MPYFLTILFDGELIEQKLKTFDVKKNNGVNQ